MDVHDRWMHTTEIAAELGVSPETVRRLIRSRKLRATVLVVGGRPTFRILHSDYERFRRTFAKDSTIDDWE
jgi:excisionase family DNA binding protein